MQVTREFQPITIKFHDAKEWKHLLRILREVQRDFQVHSRDNSWIGRPSPFQADDFYFIQQFLKQVGE